MKADISKVEVREMKEGNSCLYTHGASWLKISPTINTEPHDKSTSSVTASSAFPISSSENFLKIILDLGYYAGSIPYHIKYDETLRDFVIHKNRLQMVYSVFIRVVTLFSQINHILVLKLDMVAQDPTLYFQLVRRVTFLITFTAWFSSSSSKSMEIRTFVASSYKVLPGNYRKIAKTLIAVFCLTYGVFGILGAIVVVGKTYWDPEVLINAHLNRTYSNFRLYNLPAFDIQKMTAEIHGHSLKNTATLTTILLILVQFIMGFCHDVNAWILYMFMISIAFVAWFHVKSFKDDIARSLSAEIATTIICQKYAALKAMFNNLNSIFGPTFLVWVCYIVPFTSLKIGDVASDPDWFLIMFNSVYFGHVIIFLVLSADSCAKVCECMNEWLSRDEVMVQFDCKKHTALLIELQNNPVAFRSYNGIFAITYQFIGNLFTLMTSFFIIIAQFKIAVPGNFA